MSQIDDEIVGDAFSICPYCGEDEIECECDNGEFDDGEDEE